MQFQDILAGSLAVAKSQVFVPRGHIGALYDMESSGLMAYIHQALGIAGAALLGCVSRV